MFDAKEWIPPPRERAVHLVPVGTVTEVVSPTEAWVQIGPGVTRAVCGFRGARYTTVTEDEVTCADCKRGARELRSQ